MRRTLTPRWLWQEVDEHALHRTVMPMNLKSVFISIWTDDFLDSGLVEAVSLRSELYLLISLSLD